jgi:Domain of unknown function (DUF4365)
MEHIRHDYGLDVMIRTFDVNGQMESGDIRAQVKATDRLPLLTGQEIIPWRIDSADLRHWLYEPTPVFLVIYHAIADKAYWLNVQDYFERRRSELGRMGQTVTLHIPLTNVLNDPAVKDFARYRDEVQALRRGMNYED